MGGEGDDDLTGSIGQDSLDGGPGRPSRVRIWAREVEARCVIAMSLFVAGGFLGDGQGELGRPEVMRLVLERLAS